MQLQGVTLVSRRKDVELWTATAATASGDGTVLTLSDLALMDAQGRTVRAPAAVWRVDVGRIEILGPTRMDAGVATAEGDGAAVDLRSGELLWRGPIRGQAILGQNP